ncbi:hemerythrin domain-containing protein [Marmoricola sp. RAF53]|uniref:hemerythrin domain-containing protein n=1 Tax=Marmoricola sp. RAF53 TaxID=3233059 RepID=UPI003F95054C
MTEHQTMNTVVHAAVRRDLGRFDQALAAFPADSRSRADQLKRAWDNFEEELYYHHTYEETLFWPALQEVGADLSLVQDLDGEHDAMREALEAASDVMARFHQCPSADEADRARKAVAHLSDVLLDHLAHEERDLEPISARYHDSAPMKAALKKVQKAHQGRMGNFFAWLQDGATADDRAGLRKQVPGPVVFAITAVAGRHYRRDIASVWG